MMKTITLAVTAMLSLAVLTMTAMAFLITKTNALISRGRPKMMVVQNLSLFNRMISTASS